MFSLRLGKEGLIEMRVEATFLKDRECARARGNRNGRRERLEAMVREQRDGNKVELDCLLA